jgi:peptidoglycan/LPS O-acetylase OafA/YrhL
MRSRNNAFDVLRLAAALLVLLSHCYALTTHGEPLGLAGGGTMGELGVLMFFAMSGFLVSQSWHALPRVVPFAAKRALRLLPALVVVAFATAFVLGPLVTTLAPGDYFLSSEPYTYAARTSLLYTPQGVLPGVFEDNPYPSAVNGSLWTLPLEASAYLGLVLLGLLGVLRRRIVLAGLLAVAVASTIPGVELALRLASGSGAGGTVSGDLPLIARLLTAFLAGMTIHAWRDRLPLSYTVTGILALLWVLSWGSAWLPLTSLLFVPYAVIVLAFRLPATVKRVTAPGDVSYGVYINAFPVQQLVCHLAGPIRPGVLLALAAPPVYLMAWGSWMLVERRALALKSRTGGSDPRTGAPVHPESHGRLRGRLQKPLPSRSAQ